MSGAKRPYMTFFVDDFLSDTSLLSTVATGYWIRALCQLQKLQEHRGTMVATLDKFAMICPGMSIEETEQILRELSTTGVAEVCSDLPNGCNTCVLFQVCFAKDTLQNKIRLRTSAHPGHASVTDESWCLSCRRLVREERERRNATKRKQRERERKRAECHGESLGKCHGQDTGHTPNIPISHRDSLKENRPIKQTEEGEQVVKRPKNKTNVQLVADFWNDLEVVQDGRLPRVERLSEKRKRTVATRLRDPYFKENYRRAGERIETSGFLLGENDRSWRASFDWFVRPDTVAKLLEGTYGVTDPVEPVAESPSTFDW